MFTNLCACPMETGEKLAIGPCEVLMFSAIMLSLNSIFTQHNVYILEFSIFDQI